MLDNHMVHGADKILDEQDACPSCKRLMQETEWCDEHHRKCEFCHGDDESVDCPNCITKLYCDVCEISVPID